MIRLFLEEIMEEASCSEVNKRFANKLILLARQYDYPQSSSYSVFILVDFEVVIKLSLLIKVIVKVYAFLVWHQNRKRISLPTNHILPTICKTSRRNKINGPKNIDIYSFKKMSHLQWTWRIDFEDIRRTWRHIYNLKLYWFCVFIRYLIILLLETAWLTH